MRAATGELDPAGERPGGLCPVCDRFIGPVGACPFCGESARTSSALRILRWGSPVLAVIGLAALWLAAVRRDPPLVAIGRIEPTMHRAYIRVTGRVERAPYISRKNGRTDYLSFNLADDSGVVRVAAYGEVAREIERRGSKPAKGARVRATGFLDVAPNANIRLRLPGADALEPLGDPATPDVSATNAPAPRGGAPAGGT
jgi:hypothetical protein